MLNRELVKKIFLLLLSSVVTLILLEISIRTKHMIFKRGDNQNENIFFSTFGSQESQLLILSEYDINYDYFPYLMWRASPNQNTKVFKINSIGFRGDEWIVPKPPNTFRIFLLGGSAAWGYGASSDQETISSDIEKLLNNYLKDSKITYEVLNASENGYTSSQEFILWKELLTYDPDLVIHYTGYNDIYTGLLKRKAGWNHPFIQEKILTKKRLPIIKELVSDYSISLLDSLLEKLKLYHSIKYRVLTFISSESIETNINSYTDLNDVSSVFIRNINLVSDISKVENIPVLIILQPSLITSTKQLSTEEVLFLDEFENQFPGSIEYLKKGYDLFNSGLLDLQRQGKITYLNASDVFKEYDGNVFFDTSHYSDKGNIFTANEIAKFILKKHLVYPR